MTGNYKQGYIYLKYILKYLFLVMDLFSCRALQIYCAVAESTFLYVNYEHSTIIWKRFILHALLSFPQHYHSYQESTYYTAKSKLGLIQVSDIFFQWVYKELKVIIKHIPVNVDSGSSLLFPEITPSLYAFVYLFVK